MTIVYTHVSLWTSMGEWSGIGCRVNRILSLISIKKEKNDWNYGNSNGIAAEMYIIKLKQYLLSI